jgi:hypothetical protein
MKSLLLTFFKKEPFLKALQILSQQNQWSVRTITSFDFVDGDQITHQPQRLFSFSAVCLLAAVSGIFIGFGMQWYSAVIDLPLNIGGRPLNSWPAFIPVTFILMILFSAISVFIYFFIRLHLPWPSHPLFFSNTFNLSKKQFQILLQEKSTSQELDPNSLAADQIEEVS